MGKIRRIGAVSVFSVMALGASSVLPAAALDRAQATTPGWRIIKSFVKNGLSLEGGMVAFKDGSAWAAGESETEAPVIYHLRNGKWTRGIFLGPPGSFATQVSASSPTNVWVAFANEPSVAHLSGSTWTIKSFTQGTFQVIITSVQTFGPSNTWVFYTALNSDLTVRKGFAVHFNGSTWHTIRLPDAVTGNSETGLTSASSPSNIWALSEASGRSEPMHYDGHSWQIVALPKHLLPTGQQIFLRQVLALSPANVWIAAFSASATKAGPILLLHWDGKKWSKESKGLPAGSLSGPIASDGHGGLWLAGRTPSPANKVVLLHFAQGKWTVTKAPVPTINGRQLGIGTLTRVPGTKSSLLGDAAIVDLVGATSGGAIIKFGS